ncbi:hypothetical protein Tco_0363196 [Tanacetum coccineum]
MESIQNIPKANLPYGMLLTRLFTHIVSSFPELSNDRYILCDRVMHPLAPYYEQKVRSYHGTKRCRSSNPSLSFNVLDHPSSSHHIDENDDGNNEESFHSNTPSPSQLINSFQYRDEHRKGLRSIGGALKNALRVLSRHTGYSISEAPKEEPIEEEPLEEPKEEG